ncbi:MAG TPA: DNA alkylation repair protein [Chryseosolibacter sp.]|nr:DNA alkylation repair protein [Chryseosolibacter sp.]
MATPLKYMYNPTYFETLCPVLKHCIPNFDCRDFIFRIFDNQWPDLELKQRVRHISRVLRHFLPEDFRLAAKHIVSVAEELEKRTTTQGFEHIFLPDYIEVFGLGHPQESFEALEQITKLVSAEFAVRPFILQDPIWAMQFFRRWSLNENANVRRLASEGCRPRLPWAVALPMFKKDPLPLLPILDNLKDDASLYVRKSVANNLNDISKDHPDLVLEVARKWKDTHPHTNWIIRHGCRSLLKQGNRRVLTLHGYRPDLRASVTKFTVPAKVPIGGDLTFNFHFENRENRAADFRLDYAIDYLTSTGKKSRKVFKISENSFEPRRKMKIERKQSFKDLTTRKHFAGKHHITILANGKKLAVAEFLVC